MRGAEPCFKLFQDKETAKYVLETFLGINGQRNESIRAIESDTSPEQYKAFSRGVGHLMCKVFEPIVDPISKQHPSLRAKEMEEYNGAANRCQSAGVGKVC